MRSLQPQEIHDLFADGVVRHGPFAGLRYPELVSIGSSLYPKLLGSYESEIHPWIHEICDAGYTEIIDVGCAEGYYAAGLAMRIPRARVFAYDTAPEARQLCAAMASANGVGDRVVVRGTFTIEEIDTILVRERGLIVCDCEGYETQLFNERSCDRFSAWDILVETHDFIDITISTRIAAALRGAPALRSMLSIDDIQKAKSYEYRELDDFDLATRRSILAEYRPTIMEWLFATN